MPTPKVHWRCANVDEPTCIIPNPNREYITTDDPTKVTCKKCINGIFFPNHREIRNY